MRDNSTMADESKQGTVLFDSARFYKIKVGCHDGKLGIFFYLHNS